MQKRLQWIPSIFAPFYALLSGWLLSLILVFGAAFTFLELAEDVWLKEGFSWDVPLMRDIHRLSTPWLDTLMKSITLTASGAVIVLVVAVVVWLWHGRRQRVEALTISTALIGSVIINTILKLIFARPRPEVFPPLTVEHSYSFPSGHTSTAIAFYGLLAVLLWRAHHRGWALLSGGWVLAVAFSRVYLGVHYPSDVLGSLTLGVVWLFAVLLVYDRYHHETAQMAP
jgi:membrane-associated phospholipid phosphatase